jgi:hypothetical protein
MSKAFVFHPTKGAKIVEAEEVSTFLKGGWYDDPQKFPDATVESTNQKIQDGEFKVEQASHLPRADGKPELVTASSGIVNPETVFQPRKKR